MNMMKTCTGFFLIYILIVLAAAGEPETNDGSASPNATVDNKAAVVNCANISNETNTCAESSSLRTRIMENQGMLKRTFFVLLGITGIVVIYFVVRAARLKSRSNKTRKYGLLTRPDKLEMQPLDMDDEDEDVTVYEMNGRQR